MNELVYKLEEVMTIVSIWIVTVFVLYFVVKEMKQAFFWFWVPYVPTSDYRIKKFTETIKMKKWQKFLDLWCWDWRVLEEVKNKNPNNLVCWIENSPGPYRLALKRREENKLDYEIINTNFFKEDFSKYDIIYSFMIPYLMKRIWKKIKSECKKGTLFYSASFKIRGEKEHSIIEIKKDKYCSYIYVYRV